MSAAMPAVGNTTGANSTHTTIVPKIPTTPNPAPNPAPTDPAKRYF